MQIGGSIYTLYKHIRHIYTYITNIRNMVYILVKKKDNKKTENKGMERESEKKKRRRKDKEED